MEDKDWADGTLGDRELKGKHLSPPNAYTVTPN